MAKSNASEMLTSLDSLFTTQEQRDEAKRDSVQDIPISQISDFPEHPFKVKQDEAMLEMAESVRQYGVLVPGLVRQLEDGSYQMVSGHRRKLASELAGRDTIPCIVRDLTDDEAVIIMVDSNLQRERVLPSEKAFAYKMKLDAMRRQAGRPSKENGVPLGHHFQQGKSREILADNSPDSNTQIQRYIRLTNLIPEILDMVDDGRIAFRPAVELSYLAEQEQRILYDAMGHADCTPSLAQAIKMKSFSREGKLSEAVIRSIMAEEKPNQKEQFRIPKERISKYFKPGTPARTMEDTIIKALDYYRKRQREMERRIFRPGESLPIGQAVCRGRFCRFPLSTPHPPSYRLYRLKKRLSHKSISYRKQHPFPDGAFYFTLRRSNK